MAKDADLSSKQAIDQTAEAWIRWLLADQDVVVEARLSTEFQFVGRRNDSLLRARGKAGRFLALTEIQLRHDPDMPRRMRAYAALAEEKYHLPVYPIVIYLLPPPEGAEIATRFYQEFMGLVAQQDFCVVKVWEIDPWAVLRKQVLTLAPFVPLMRDADEAAVRASAALLRQQPGLEDLDSVLAFFASLRFGSEEVKRMMDWMIELVRETPLYQEILEEGLQEGHRKGHREGRREGLVEGRRQSLLDLLAHRFGPVPKGIERRLAARPLPDLAALIDVALDVDSLADFEAQLAVMEQSSAEAADPEQRE